VFRILYGVFSYVGVVSLFAAFTGGFRHEPSAPLYNVIYDIVLYGAFIAVHLVMTMPAFKRAVFGRPEGTGPERRLYVTVSVVTWVGVYALHAPVPGFAWTSPPWLEFLGLCGILLSLVAFFEFATFEGLASLLGMPGAPLSHSAGAETPLMTHGPYANVRHPMYRAAILMTLASLLVHPNATQLLFALLVSGSFLGFIPFEEDQLLRHRGEAYREYAARTPYRVLRGVW
jgi:protein-S-isoprenylcysteine O-methyltransferase Ste14